MVRREAPSVRRSSPSLLASIPTRARGVLGRLRLPRRDPASAVSSVTPSPMRRLRVAARRAVSMRSGVDRRVIRSRPRQWGSSLIVQTSPPQSGGPWRATSSRAWVRAKTSCSVPRLTWVIDVHLHAWRHVVGQGQQLPGRTCRAARRSGWLPRTMCGPYRSGNDYRSHRQRQHNSQADRRGRSHRRQFSAKRRRLG